MQRGAPAFAVSILLAIVLVCVAPARAQQADADRFELRGRVINSSTSEPVPWALVKLAAAEARSQFTGPDGTFVFDGLPRGQYDVWTRKPGYFNEAELAQIPAGRRATLDVPSSRPLVLRLTPEGVIYGELKNEVGEPVEGMVVDAENWQAHEDRRQLSYSRSAVSDDEGRYRVAE